jgi:site-specific DNA recombinase
VDLPTNGGLVKCGHCGALVSGEAVTKKTTGKQYFYYRCAQYNYPGHPRHRVTEADLDKQIVEAFASMKQDKDTAAWFVEVIKARGQDAMKQDEKKIAELQRQMTSIRKQQDELLDMRIEGDIDQDTFAAKSTQLRDRLAELEVDVVACDRSRSDR